MDGGLEKAIRSVWCVMIVLARDVFEQNQSVVDCAKQAEWDCHQPTWLCVIKVHLISKTS